MQEDKQTTDAATSGVTMAEGGESDRDVRDIEANPAEGGECDRKVGDIESNSAGGRRANGQYWVRNT